MICSATRGIFHRQLTVTCLKRSKKCPILQVFDCDLYVVNFCVSCFIQPIDHPTRTQNHLESPLGGTDTDKKNISVQLACVLGYLAAKL